ncbi:Uncharacterized protein PCOAH_00050740 [Plasmodium coatneyi]|uniref:RRM domain-containing protein n=1 Tax=Plasmodium coatneyi TaxID=208452 RepID=A0A1B1E661_9APIC|nr:Uncharacterized protein PCOAH_00050740 [Plasmodium coatneyi]ANQ10478.1 Uncharacterized protein PCOAH_00050740 [Plasmodium coatneyi]
MAKRSDKKNAPIDRHKVFVRNIRENDVAPLEEEFKKICTKYFFFKNKNNTTKSAICSFKTDREAENFIQKYHDKKIQTSNIKCEFAFRKKYNEKKLISITYRRHKINHMNSIQLYTNCDLDTIVVLSYLKNIFLLHRHLLVKCLDEHDQAERKTSQREVGSQDTDGKNHPKENDQTDKDEDHSEEATQKSDGDGDADEDDVQVVAEKKLKEFEEIVLNIEKENKNLDKKMRKKIIAKKSKKNKGISKNCFVYTIEFLNLKFAAHFYKYINRKNFLNYLEDNVKNEGKKDVFFFHELCYFNKNNKRVIVKNIKRTCHVENLQKLFKHIEKDPSIYFPKKDNKKQGYALVTFSSYENVKKALLLNKSKLCGSTIIVEEDKNPRLLKMLGVQAADHGEKNHQVRDGVTDKEVDGEGSEDGTNDGEESNDETDEGEEEEDDEDRDDEDRDDDDDDDDVDDDDDDEEQHDQRPHDRASDVEEGKTLFITNIPMGSTDEEVQSYVTKNISKNYVYIRTCRNNGKKISAFVKLKYKEDADTFLKKIGEYHDEKEQEDGEDDEEENVIDKFYNMKKKKKERMKQILLKDQNSGKNAEILFFKNNYLMIKRAVKDNDINNDHLGENIIKRNNDLMEKKKQLLKNKNFLINPCRIYVRNYPASLEQNLFRQLITKYFTPLFMEKHNLKKKEAFKKANEIIKKMKIMKDHTKQKELAQNEEKNKKLKDKKSNNKSGQNLICFIDINKHEHAKQIIHFLQNRNIYELINEIIYKKKFQTIRKNKNIMYVDYCIEDIRMVHIKKLKEEKFLNHIRQKNGAETNSPTKKTIKKKKKKESRGRRQREKRRLLRMQNENTNIAHVIKNTSSVHVQQSNVTTGQEKKNAQTNSAHKISATKKKSNLKLKEKNPNQGAHSKEASKKKKVSFQIGEKEENTKKKTSKKLIKKAGKKSATKKDKDIESIQKDVLNFLKKNKK